MFKEFLIEMDIENNQDEKVAIDNNNYEIFDKKELENQIKEFKKFEANFFLFIIFFYTFFLEFNL